MSNAVARYSVWDKSIKDFKLKYVNAKEVKKSFNMSVSHKMGEHWTLDLNYSHANDDWKAKNGMVFDPDLTWTDGNVNSVINKLRPQNTYTANCVLIDGVIVEDELPVLLLSPALETCAKSL